ncbi:hypothetical protein PPO43_01700 [Saprospira sp. CCB-QB6]|uniref:hypothetical protein n=1 Tax=Saprospira sp. CCB-QB6 TaxID=3023936 RepID=UPI00234943AF|nr:hypothetical protein [Saprospira sp. CCB-QB6]WCL81810.1 hypothetical protein PPO43_01700 [Saprospira sp. CCB-QB6]
MKTKIDFSKIAELTKPAYEKEFKRLSKAAFTQANSEDTAVTFYVKRQHKFACGAEGPLMLIAKLDAKWKKQAKEDLKGDKKMIMIAKAFVKEGENGATLEVSPMKGNAPLAKIAKEAKAMLKKAKLTLSEFTASAASAELTDAAETAEEQPQTEETTATEEPAATAPEAATTVDPQLEKKKAKAREVMAKMLENLQKIESKLQK